MLNEITALSTRYTCLDFTFTDNALPPKEAEKFFRATRDSRKNYHFFGEIRLLNKPETYNLYRQGGLQSVQIGIEAFSDSLLRSMDKGTRVIDNIAAMKYSMAAGIRLDGNLIVNFPRSTKEEVRETLRVLDFVLPFHPLKSAAFFLGHGSPVHCNPHKYNISAYLQHPKNIKLFPPRILDQLTLLVKSYRGDGTVQKKQWQPVVRKIEEWQRFHADRTACRPALTYRDGSTFLIIRQEITDGRSLHHTLKGTSRKIYLYCEYIRSEKELLETFNLIKKEQLVSFLKDLEEKRLLFCDGERYLALAILESSHTFSQI